MRYLHPLSEILVRCHEHLARTRLLNVQNEMVVGRIYLLIRDRWFRPQPDRLRAFLLPNRIVLEGSRQSLFAMAVQFEGSALSIK